MMTGKLHVLAFALLASPVPSAAHELFAVIPSGLTEVEFGLSSAETADRLGSLCQKLGYTVAGTTGTELTCDMPERIVRPMLELTPDERGKPTKLTGHVIFAMTERQGLTHVQVQAWVEGRGRRKGRDGDAVMGRLNTVTFQNEMIYELTRNGGLLPMNTAFPNHAFLGVNGEEVSWHGGKALRVAHLTSVSPAGEAGAQPGDVIFRIAGLAWQDFNGYLDAMAKATEQPTYDIALKRDGKTVTLSVRRMYRGPIAADAEQAEKAFRSLLGS